MRLGQDASTSRMQDIVLNGYGVSSSFVLFKALANHFLRKGIHVRICVQCAADQTLSKALYTVLRDSCAVNALSICFPNNQEELLSSLDGRDSYDFQQAPFSYIFVDGGCPVIGIYFEEHGHKMPGTFELFGYENACFNGRTCEAADN